MSKNEKFRNQQVLVVIEVPVGKKIELDRSVDDFNWFSMNFNRRRGFNVEWDDSWDYTYSWSSNTEYIMTPNGLEKTDNLGSNSMNGGRLKRRADENGVENEADDRRNRQDQNKNNGDNKADDNRYRYRREEAPVIDTVKRRTITSELMVPFAAFSNIL
ncbi:MAG: hypothetical protein EOO94_02605 [Pedobacter sp.]|nr:MAG: hypothetical protein EOO94_02605 [Pedobacter sp.]